MDNIAAVDVSFPTMDQIPKKEKYLIAFNKFKKITFFGTCKVEVNKTDKCLIFRTNSTEKKFQEFVSTFSRIFVPKENALCIIDAISNNDFMLIFPLKSTCDRIIEEINKVKFPSGPPTADPATDDYLFKNNFYIPILKEIRSKITGFMDIKTVLLDLVNKFEPDQRQTYMNIVFETLLSTDSSVIDSAVDESGTVTNDNEASAVNDETFNVTANSTDNQSLNDTTTSNNYSFRKRRVIDYSSNHFSSSNSSNHETSSASKKSRQSSAAGSQMDTTPSSKNEIVTASYEFVECFRQNAIRKRILIFTSDEKNECYEFYINNNGWHNCKGCSKMNQRTVIKIVSVENGKMEFKQGKNKHICMPFKYLPDNYTTRKQLSLEDFLKTAASKEKSELRRIQKPNFKIEMVPQKFQREKLTKVLTICDPAYGNQEFSYYYNQKDKRFYCRRCHKNRKYVSAKLVEDGDGEESIEVSAVEHVCL